MILDPERTGGSSGRVDAKRLGVTPRHASGSEPEPAGGVPVALLRERSWLARDLHDLVIQDLIALGMQILA